MRDIQDIIMAILRESPHNRLSDLDNGPVYEDCLVGVADGHDPLFARYKSIIGEFHLTPEEVMQHAAPRVGLPYAVGPLRVVCWSLPFARHIVRSNAAKECWPSIKWAHAYDAGEAVNNQVREAVTQHFLRQGILAAAPVRTPEWHRVEHLPEGHTSNWSERHALFAAGMGTFSINDGFITERGMAMRCGSVVVNAELPITERAYADHRENCLFVAEGTCGICMERCPAYAITARGHDKVKCRQYRERFFDAILNKLCAVDVRVDFCGLCQAGTPCASANPRATRRAADAAAETTA